MTVDVEGLGGFWTPLLKALERLVETGFVRREVMNDLIVADNLDEALAGLATSVAADFDDKGSITGGPVR